MKYQILVLRACPKSTFWASPGCKQHVPVALHRHITADIAASGALVMLLSLGLWPQRHLLDTLLERTSNMKNKNTAIFARLDFPHRLWRILIQILPILV